jgi:SpoVK/Ycf46/Vps4 family AAA+-type ATPase
MHTQVKIDRLKALFQAFSQKNESAFIRTAESIILEELAANHHAGASELKRALTPQNGSSRIATTGQVNPLPKDRRQGEDLLFFDQSPILTERLILNPPTHSKISRVLDEQRRRTVLAKFGYLPKSKLVFWGPPGCGKTLTARYLAKELGLPLAVLRISAVISSFVGDTAAHIQRVFTRAAQTPMVLLLDEVDAIGKNRDDPNDVGELKRVVNGLLQAIDNFKGMDSLLIVASNHQHLLDPALWRRFDDIVPFPIPDNASRLRFLRMLLSGVQFQGTVALVSAQMDGLSYAEIEHISVETVKTMILEDRSTLEPPDLLAEIRNWKQSIGNAKQKPKTPSQNQAVAVKKGLKKKGLKPTRLKTNTALRKKSKAGVRSK